MRDNDETKISAWLKNASAQHPRYGFKMLFNLMRKSGMHYNHKRVYRIYCALKLNLKIKPKKRLAPRTAVTLEQPEKANMSWSLDYMSDTLSHGRRFRTANVIDDFNREVLGILVAYGLPSKQITAWLDCIAETKGYPKKIRVDNGPENIAKHFVKWATEHHIEIEYIQPGKPAQNAYIERFNRSYRESVLDMYLFNTIGEVQRLTNKWLSHYNHERPHKSLGYLTPIQYKRHYAEL